MTQKGLASATGIAEITIRQYEAGKYNPKIGQLQKIATVLEMPIDDRADNFNVIRRLTVLNTRTDKPLFELIAAFSFTLEGNRIIVTCETGPNEYKKHSIGLNDWTLWVVEDISGTDVDKHRYEVNFLPEMIIPVTFTSNN